MNWKKYPKYKDSGIEWIKGLPEHWKVIPTKSGYHIQLGKMLQNNLDNKEDVLVNYIKALHVNWGKVSTSELPEMWASPSELIQYGIKTGDLLVCEGGEVGRAGIVQSPPQPCIIQNAIHRIRNKTGYDVSFLLYILHHVKSSGWIEVLCNKATIAHFTREKIAELRFSIPSMLIEQQTIVNFLNNETSRIDILITKKEHMIDLLKEKRSAFITLAVTKGLNPNVKMKNSGIEWLGKIPEHWELKRLKYCVSINMGQSPDSDDYNDEGSGHPFLQGNAEFGSLNPTPIKNCMTARKIVHENDILLSVRAPVGALNIADQEYGIGRGLCGLTSRRQILIQSYLWFLLHHMRFQLDIISNGSTYVAVSVEDVSNIIFPIPPINEQNVITSRIEKITQIIDKLIEKTEYSIITLREYRSALISAAITGKIDVRGSN